MQGEKLYLYLAKRDKKNVKVIMTLQGLKILPSRVEDINKLRLPSDIIPELQTILENHKMEWELWIEPAVNFGDLRNKLEKRGYHNLPHRADPLHSASSFNNPHVADTRFLKKTSMIRKFT